MKYTKYLLLILVGLLAFQVGYSQLPDDTTADIDPSKLLEQEDQSEEQVEENVENGNGIEGPQEIDAPDDIEDFTGQETDGSYANISVAELFKSQTKKKVIYFCFLSQTNMLKGYGLIDANSTYIIDKVKSAEYDESKDIWRFTIRIKDSSNDSNFFIGQSILRFNEKPKLAIDIRRNRFGIGLEEITPITDPEIINGLESGWSEMSAEFVEKNPDASALLDFGIESTLKVAVPINIPTGDWSLMSITIGYIQTKDNGEMYYHFNVILIGPGDYAAFCDIVVLRKSFGNESFISASFDGYIPP